MLWLVIQGKKQYPRVIVDYTFWPRAPDYVNIAFNMQVLLAVVKVAEAENKFR